ncbi:hypothetical protein Egran_06092 [Elaphomyces granulatus]|uniref:Uncharacterized protein n=1 Tax=Elaphomyces granulatus TaxID=519963 RepID=A0A232LPP6_9EURO|nr:hypothetical protein Egran_06092 [Elaphomyces granulatus]
MYEEIEEAIEVNDWVGSIKADIESIIPPSINCGSLFVQAGDLVHPEHHHELENFDPHRRVDLDLQVLREFLAEGRETLAYHRSLKYLCPRRGEE